MDFNRIASILITVICTVFILIYLEDILIPFVLALLIWFLIKEVKRFIGKLRIKDAPLPAWLRTLLSMLLIFGVLGGVIMLLTANIKEIREVLPEYQSKILSLQELLNDRWSIDLNAELKKVGGKLDLEKIMGEVLNTLTSVLGNTFMILIYVAFLLLEQALFRPKLKAIFEERKEFDSASSILNKIDNSLSDYVSLKTLVSLVTGVASFIVLWAIGVDFAFFWAFLIFLLNYIPTIGSLIGTVFPALIALLQFDSFQPALLVLVCVGAVQVLVGNVLEPKLMGNSLNVSPLVVILSLAFWGSIWGVVGMILSVPITVMMVIVFSQFKSTRAVAVLLSEKGNLK